jgi:type I restriction enzyme, S subunit
MEENRKYKISELATSNSSQYSKNEKWSIVRYLDTGSITNNIIEEMQTIRMGVDEFPSRARRKVKRGDIIYSTVRPNQKHFGYIENPAENMLVSTGFTVLSVNEDVADSKYLYYWLSQQSIIDYLHAVGEQAVSAYPSIKAKDIEDLEIILPPLFEQRHISSILTCIDSKIELNRRINDNLIVMVA